MILYSVLIRIILSVSGGHSPRVLGLGGLGGGGAGGAAGGADAGAAAGDDDHDGDHYLQNRTSQLTVAIVNNILRGENYLDLPLSGTKPTQRMVSSSWSSDELTGLSYTCRHNSPT